MPIPVCSHVEKALLGHRPATLEVPRVLRQEHEDGDHTEDQSEEEPQPCVPVGILCPQGAKGSKQEQHSAIGTVGLNRGWDARNPALELRNPTLDLRDPPVKPLVRKRRVGPEDKKQRGEQGTHDKSRHSGFLSPSTRILQVQTADYPRGETGHPPSPQVTGRASPCWVRLTLMTLADGPWCAPLPRPSKGPRHPSPLTTPSRSPRASRRRGLLPRASFGASPSAQVAPTGP